jgi:hypothetical protein
MKRFGSTLIFTLIFSHASLSQSVKTVTPSNADVGQCLAVNIVCSSNLIFCSQLASWRVCDTIKRVYFQKGDSIREAYSISNIKDSTIVALVGFPLSSPAGAWDVAVEEKKADTSGGTIQKIVKTGGFTLNALSNPVVDAISPTVAYQNRKVIFDIISAHAHFKIAQQDSMVNNVTNAWLTKNASSIQADSFSIQSSVKMSAYFTLKNSGDTGLFDIKIDQGSGLPSVALQKAVSIKDAPPSLYSLPEGCIAFYPFEGDAVDRSYNGNNGAISNALFVDGFYGQALYFNGNSSYVSVPNSTSLTTTNGLSISAWIKVEIDSFNYGSYALVSKEPKDWLFLINPSEAIYFEYYKNGYQNTSFCYNGMQPNQWNHILCTWNGAVIRYFINGELQPDSGQLTPPIENSINAMLIGKSSVNGYYFKGLIDEIMIFNRGLSAVEADSIFKGMYFKKSQNDSTIPVVIPYKSKVTLDPRPKFVWHPVAGATSYMLSVATSETFSTIIFQTPLSDTAFSPSVNLPIGTVYWHVKSDLGIRWSLADNFIIQSDTIPFINRFDGAVVNLQRPKFVWNKVVKANTYKIEIANNPLFINPYLTMPVNDTTFTPLGNIKNGMNYWRVSCDRNISLFCEPDSVDISFMTYSIKENSPFPAKYACVLNGTSKRGSFINYSLPAPSAVSIKLYSLQGKLLKEIPQAYKQPGYYQSFLGISDLSKGYYIVDFKAGIFRSTQRISNF